MNFWTRTRLTVLERASQGAFYAGSGYGAVFEETMACQRDGLLRTTERGGATYVEITAAGREELARMRAGE